ncbi:AcuB1 [Desulforapulum autotrophicum HRM2]|uniref:AcuB1 n=1 Tax=Desulforapulum autotrophicum (strain ATCC 43914 / DSM 3382 / VKM B-1955 / HRM2) TaxID=177437 RepID=C0QFY5_DESAH|nr:CBS and ACT domain-containing protein [Desulforapulum autotrophicum]ACN15553.1 AcuB1 [Desulforapulum autotrophicum HRM2]
MLVKHWMTKNVITVDTDCTLERAISFMKSYKIRMMPVLKNGVLKGVVTDRDLKRASASDAVKTTHVDRATLASLANMKISTIMTKDPIRVPYNYSIDETAELLLENKISGAPVVDDMDNLVGVITQTNVYKALISLTGKRKNSVQVGVVIKDTRNAIQEIDDLLEHHGGRIISILTSDDNMPKGYRKVFVRLGGVDRIKLDSIIDGIQSKGELIYVIDHHDNIRMVYK